MDLRGLEIKCDFFSIFMLFNGLFGHSVKMKGNTIFLYHQ